MGTAIKHPVQDQLCNLWHPGTVMLWAQHTCTVHSKH